MAKKKSLKLMKWEKDWNATIGKRLGKKIIAVSKPKNRTK